MLPSESKRTFMRRTLLLVTEPGAHEDVSDLARAVAFANGEPLPEPAAAQRTREFDFGREVKP